MAGLFQPRSFLFRVRDPRLGRARASSSPVSDASGLPTSASTDRRTVDSSPHALGQILDGQRLATTVADRSSIMWQGRTKAGQRTAGTSVAGLQEAGTDPQS